MTRQRLKSDSTANLLLVVTFFLISSLPLIQWIFPLVDDIEGTEKRVLVSRPVFEWGDIWDYLEAYKKYFNDNFGFRNHLILLNHLFYVEVLKIVPGGFEDKTKRRIKRVILGSDNWLFYNAKYLIEDFQGKRAFTEKELQRIKSNLEIREAWMESKGVKSYILIPPNKHTIYGEYLPAFMQRRRDKDHSRLEQLIRYLNDNSDIRLVDIREALTREKSRGILLYSKTDTHWNEYGSFIGCRELIRVIKEDFNGIRPLSLDDYTMEVARGKGGDLAHMLTLQDSMKEDWVKLVFKGEPGSRSLGISYDYGFKVYRREIKNEKLPGAVILGTSFINNLMPHLSEHFSRSTYVFDYRHVKTVIEKEKPDIFIQELVERELGQLLRFTL